jgi:hypothetical protein
LSVGILTRRGVRWKIFLSDAITSPRFQIIRDNTPAGFSVRVTLYGKADKKTADRAIICVQREKRRHFHLTE